MADRIAGRSSWRNVLGAAALATAVVAGCAGGDGGATQTPAAPQPLPPGDYASQAFRPAASFTLPAGWLITQDSPDFFALQPVSADAVGIYLFRSPAAASQAADCPTTRVPGLGPTAKDLVDWIEANPGLQTTDRTSVVVGGLLGFELEIGIVPGWAVSCPFADGLPTVPLLVSEASGLRWVVAGSERLRLSVLDVPGSGTVVVDIDAFEGALFDGFVPAAVPIVSSLRFAAP
jgi:hypothetical protein